MNRRLFLKSLLTILSATAAASFAYPLMRFLAPPGNEAKGKKILVNKSEIPKGEAREILYNGVPAIIINRTDKGFIALSRVCTHLGCLVEYDKAKNRLQCPCHAGIFNLEGNVVSGPPPKPLQEFPLGIDGENIVIG